MALVAAALAMAGGASSPCRADPGLVLNAAADDDGLRLGADGSLRLLGPRKDAAWPRPGDAAAFPGAGLQFGAVQTLGSPGTPGATFASLKGRFDAERWSAWLGIGGRFAGNADPGSAHLNLGGGWAPRLRAVQIEVAGFASPVTVPGGVIRPVFHAPGAFGRDSTYFGDPEPAPSHDALWTSGQGTLRWRNGRSEIATIAGITVGPFTAPQRWAQARLRYRMTPQWTLTFAAGRASPVALTFDPRSAPRTQIGVEFTPLRARGAETAADFLPRPRHWTVVDLGGGRAALHLECRDAARLEVRGDFSDWEPLAMEPLGGGWWEGIVHAEPGLHAIQLRMDGGAWCAPPGLPIDASGEQGPAGTIFVQ